jgi:cytoskeletal protein RodZ
VIHPSPLLIFNKLFSIFVTDCERVPNISFVLVVTNIRKQQKIGRCYSLSELGQRLKQARTEKNITLEELQSVTKIQKRYLQNVEEGNFDALPGVFYARAFVKQYAEAVGLDPEMVFEEYKNELPSTQKEGIPEQLSRVNRTKAEVNASNSKVFQLLPKVLVTVVIIGIAVTVWSLLQKDNPTDQVEQPETETKTEIEVNTENPLKISAADESNEEDESNANEEEAEKDTGAPEEVQPAHQIELVETSGRTSTYNLTNTNQFLVEVSTTGETWLDLKNGKNKKFYSAMLTAKDTDEIPNVTSYDYSNEEVAIIRLGYSENATIKINGQVLEIPKEPKDLQNITINFVKTADQQ